MDASHLAEAFAIIAIAVAFGRFVVISLSGVGDVVASVFVPRGFALGWPRGVQEIDEPWGWRPGRRTEPEILTTPDDRDEGRADGRGPDDQDPPPRSGSLVVPVGRVAPIHLGVRPH